MKIISGNNNKNNNNANDSINNQDDVINNQGNVITPPRSQPQTQRANSSNKNRVASRPTPTRNDNRPPPPATNGNDNNQFETRNLQNDRPGNVPAPPLPFVQQRPPAFVRTNPNPDFTRVFVGNYCPGGSLDICRGFCYSENFEACAAKCAQVC